MHKILRDHGGNYECEYLHECAGLWKGSSVVPRFKFIPCHGHAHCEFGPAIFSQKNLIDRLVVTK